MKTLLIKFVTILMQYFDNNKMASSMTVVQSRPVLLDNKLIKLSALIIVFSSLIYSIKYYLYVCLFVCLFSL